MGSSGLMSLALLLSTQTVSAQTTATGQLHFAETEFGRSMEATSGGISVPFDSKQASLPLTIQLRVRIEPRSFRFANYLLDAVTAQGVSRWKLSVPPKSGLRLDWNGNSTSGITAGPSLADGRWHDIAVLLEPERVRLVVDRQTIADETIAPGYLADDADRLWIGQAASGERGCDGWLDDIKVSRGLREPAEVWHRDEQSLVYFDFEEAAGDYLAKWTPLRSTRPDSEPWEQEDDDDWIDERFQQMDKGRVFACSTGLPGHNVGKKTLSLTLGRERGPTVRGPMGMFDTERCVMIAGLDEAFIRISPRRFGILEMPVLEGDERFFADARQGWLRVTPGEQVRTPADHECRVHYEGYYRRGSDTILSYNVDQADVLEEVTQLGFGDESVFRRRLMLGQDRPLASAVQLTLLSQQHSDWVRKEPDLFVGKHGEIVTAVRLLTTVTGPRLENTSRNDTALIVPAGRAEVELLIWSGPAARLDEFLKVDVPESPPLGGKLRGGPSRWAPILTSGVVDDWPQGPLALDSITPPLENPWQALLFLTGVDFFSSGTKAAVCTLHGDIWLVDGLDETLHQVRWHRFATGLYQPLGFKIVNDVVHVLGRDQITRLHDLNQDDEADFYENFNNDLQITGTPHAYAACLETDPAGYFYFFKCGQSLPHGGKLLRVSPDGGRLEAFASGYRHPVGLGISPTGLITAADNQGNWVPSSSIQVVSEGSFHGYMPEVHQPDRPDQFDPPLCWIPVSEDNASGGQVWVPSTADWGPFAGMLLHLSWGRCTLQLVLPEQVDGSWQGGVTRIPGLKFLSGPIMGRFNPHDQQLYVVGLDGWQTAATQDGCFHRVRYHPSESCLPLSLQACVNGLQVAFTQPLERTSATNVDNWRIEQWQYRWSAEYGSPEFSISEPNRIGHDSVRITRVDLSDDGRTVFLHMPDIAPVMQMHIEAVLTTAAGNEAPVSISNTIHHLAPAIARE